MSLVYKMQNGSSCILSKTCAIFFTDHPPVLPSAQNCPTNMEAAKKLPDKSLTLHHWGCFTPISPRSLAPVFNAREFPGQPFSAMNKRFFSLEQALSPWNTFTNTFKQTHASFFTKIPDLSLTIFILEGTLWELVYLTAGGVHTFL